MLKNLVPETYRVSCRVSCVQNLMLVSGARNVHCRPMCSASAWSAPSDDFAVR